MEKRPGCTPAPPREALGSRGPHPGQLRRRDPLAGGNRPSAERPPLLDTLGRLRRGERGGKGLSAGWWACVPWAGASRKCGGS